MSAYLRRVHSQGGFGVVERKGEAQAGAIFLKIDNLSQGTTQLFMPASQSELSESQGRQFTPVVKLLRAEELQLRFTRELKRDNDLWILAIESQTGQNFLRDDEIIL